MTKGEESDLDIFSPAGRLSEVIESAPILDSDFISVHLNLQASDVLPSTKMKI